MQKSLQAFYRKKAVVKNGQGNPRERLPTSSSLENPAEMLHCRKSEQQYSAAFEVLRLTKGEGGRVARHLHCLGKVNSKQRSSEQQKRKRPDCFQDWKCGLVLDRQLRHAGTADCYGGFQTIFAGHLDYYVKPVNAKEAVSMYKTPPPMVPVPEGALLRNDPRDGNKTCEEEEGMKRWECEHQLKMGKKSKGMG
ncbi:hypothetical protein STEG23_034486 [Scotinomys teguina]